MTVDEILAALAYNRGVFPLDAVREAVARRDEIVPHLVRVLDDTVAHADERAKDDGFVGHLFALYLLAQFRDPRGLPAAIALCRLPPAVVEDLLDDTIAEGIADILASLWNGDLAPLQGLIEDAKGSEWIRCAGLYTINTLVYEGLLPRQQAVDYYRHLFHGGLERDPAIEMVWGNLVEAACALHPAELRAEIRQAFDEHLVDATVTAWADVEHACERTQASAMKLGRQQELCHLIDSAEDEMAGWVCWKQDGVNRPRRAQYDDLDDVDTDENEPEDADVEGEDVPHEIEHPYVREQPKTGRNDPCPCGSGKKFKKCCGR